jgi:hypothetical protein
MPFYSWYCERENIYGRIRNWIRKFLLVKEDPNPDPKLGRKWDLNPDPDKKNSFGSTTLYHLCPYL